MILPTDLPALGALSKLRGSQHALDLHGACRPSLQAHHHLGLHLVQGQTPGQAHFQLGLHRVQGQMPEVPNMRVAVPKCAVAGCSNAPHWCGQFGGTRAGMRSISSLLTIGRQAAKSLRIFASEGQVSGVALTRSCSYCFFLLLCCSYSAKTTKQSFLTMR